MHPKLSAKLAAILYRGGGGGGGGGEMSYYIATRQLLISFCNFVITFLSPQSVECSAYSCIPVI